MGAVAWLGGLLLDPEAALLAYLTAYAFGLSLALGALCLIMIAHVTGAGWFVAVRRVAEGVAGTLPLFALLALPILLGLETLYPWAGAVGLLPERLQEAVVLKDGYLNARFFVVRAVAYFVVWIGLVSLFRRWSVRQDRMAEEEGLRARVGNPVLLSAIGLPAFAFTVTFASVDWIMSLDPTWSSSIFGIYYFAGGFLGALSVMVLLVRGFRSGGLLSGAVARSHVHALGRLMLTFVAFWAYIAFSQLFIVWIADVPTEVSWYLARWDGGWAVVLVLLAVGHFAVPFFALLSRELKRNVDRLAMIAAWLLVMHWIDLFWLVMPTLSGGGPWPGWEQPAALLMVVGLAGAFGAWRMDGRPLVAVGDPGLDESLAYESR